MDTACPAGATFGQQHFGAAVLGDRRRTRRLVRTADQIARHPGGTLPDKMASPANLKALYRLANTEQVTHAAVLEPHRQRTLARMRAHAGVVLVVHDSTELDYTGKHSLADLGQIGNGFYRGYICHNSLAVVAQTREVLGLANQILHRREDAPEGETRTAKRERETRESLLWPRATAAIGPAPAGCQWVDVADRGADTFEFLDAEDAQQRTYVVRSCQDRAIQVGHGARGRRAALHAYARRLPEQGRRAVRVGERPGQPARQAQVAVAFAPVTLLPPRNACGKHRGQPLPVWAVRAWEVQPPAGVEPIEWIVLANVAVTDADKAGAVLDWYSCRWVVEEYHKAQKTGCGIELPQFTSEEALQPVIALLSVVALLLLDLRHLSRQPEAQDRPATEVVAPEYVAVLSGWRYHEVRTGLTIKEFFWILARLGGHQNRKRDHPPGWLVLWRGWTKLQTMVDGAVAVGFGKCGQT
jgi:Transposase DNA-binding